MFPKKLSRWAQAIPAQKLHEHISPTSWLMYAVLYVCKDVKKVVKDFRNHKMYLHLHAYMRVHMHSAQQGSELKEFCFLQIEKVNTNFMKG